MWSQVYDPFDSMLVSTAVAAIPIVVLLGAIGFFEIRAHMAAVMGLAAALIVAIFGYGMPIQMATMAAAYGAAFGLLPIGWIILNVIFLYQLANESGEFAVLQRSIGAISNDRRMQLLFIAFSLGAFFEGAAGFGTPVAVTWLANAAHIKHIALVWQNVDSGLRVFPDTQRWLLTTNEGGAPMRMACENQGLIGGAMPNDHFHISFVQYVGEFFLLVR